MGSHQDNVSIRQATIDDVPRLLELEQNIIDSERPYYPYLRKNDVTYYDLPCLISAEQSTVLVMESEGKIAGSGYADIRASKSCYEYQQICYLGFIYLEPELRGKSLGMALLDALKDWGIKRGLNHFQLEVYSENESAIRAYERFGFSPLSMKMELIV